MNSVTQRSPAPTMRRTLKRFELGWAAREAWMLCRPLIRSPDCGYSSTASSRYMSCSASKSFASEAAQWRSSASRISFSPILLLPFHADPAPLPSMCSVRIAVRTPGLVAAFHDAGEYRPVGRGTVWMDRDLPSLELAKRAPPDLPTQRTGTSP